MTDADGKRDGAVPDGSRCDAGPMRETTGGEAGSAPGMRTRTPGRAADGGALMDALAEVAARVAREEARPRMSLRDRAKIFVPFDPLHGFQEALREKEREVEQRAEVQYAPHDPVEDPDWVD